MANHPSLDFALGQDLDMLRDLVRAFAVGKIAPRAAEIDRADRFRPISGPRWARSGSTASRSRKTMAAWASAISPIASPWRRSAGRRPRSGSPMARIPISASTRSAATAPRRRKRRYLPKLLSGEHIGALAMSETGAGSDVVSMRLRADKKGDRYVLNGTKMWITNGHYAETLVVYAKTDPAAGAHGITAFLIESGFQGISPGQKLDKLGMRGSPTSELVFEDCEVPEENVLGQSGHGVACLDVRPRLRADRARRRPARHHAGLPRHLPALYAERKQFGKPIGEFELVQGKLADMYTRLNAAGAYVYAVAGACDRGHTSRKDAAGALLFAAEAATKAALDAIQLLGGNGYINDYPAGRLLRDAKLYEIGAGTSEIRRMLIGRELFEGH